MLALQITSTKAFMNHLLAGDTFDIFLLEEATISTANTYTIDGHRNRDFFTQEDVSDEAFSQYSLTPWRDIKGLCFQLIKGKRTPTYFKFILHLLPEKAAILLQKEGCSVDTSQIKALVLGIKYDGEKAVLTTGSAFCTFLMTKEVDIIWDKAVCRFLSQKGIAYEEL